MSTLNQIEANRLNAQHSRGPTSDAGKAISSQNALKTGLYAKSLIIRGEKLEDFDNLKAEYFDHYQPQSPAERDCLDGLVKQTWLLRRYTAVEAKMWDFQIKNEEQAGFLDPETFLGQIFLASDQKFARLHRIVAGFERAQIASLREWERLVAARPAPEPPPQPEKLPPPPLEAEEPPRFDHSKCGPNCHFKPRSPESSATSPKIGFAPSTGTVARPAGSPAPASRPVVPGQPLDSAAFRRHQSNLVGRGSA